MNLPRPVHSPPDSATLWWRGCVQWQAGVHVVPSQGNACPGCRLRQQFAARRQDPCNLIWPTRVWTWGITTSRIRLDTRTRMCQPRRGSSPRLMRRSQVLKHCDELRKLLDEMAKALPPGGRLYLTFPYKEALTSPTAMALNFFDDDSHREGSAWRSALEQLRTNGGDRLLPKTIQTCVVGRTWLIARALKPAQPPKCARRRHI